MKKLMMALLFPPALLLASSPALAGEDSTDRYWGYGPAWYETKCGLACFQLWERSGTGAMDVSDAALRRVKTTAQLRQLMQPDQ
jgi:hypothetical protein